MSPLPKITSQGASPAATGGGWWLLQTTSNVGGPSEHPEGQEMLRIQPGPLQSIQLGRTLKVPADQCPPPAGTSTACGCHHRRWRDTSPTGDQHGGGQQGTIGMDNSVALQPDKVSSSSLLQPTWVWWPWGCDPWQGRMCHTILR